MRRGSCRWGISEIRFQWLVVLLWGAIVLLCQTGARTDSGLDLGILNVSSDAQTMQKIRQRLSDTTENAAWLRDANWSEANPCNWFGVNCSSLHQTPSDAIVVSLDMSRTSRFHSFLSGPLPASVGSLQNLTFLRIVSQNFEGPIPLELFQATSLTTLIIGGNPLKSTIPSNLGNLSRLTMVDLSNNSLHGTLDPFLALNTTFTQLQYLDLSRNNLSGGIPPALFQSAPSLEHLYLQKNRLNGSIPWNIGASENLTELDVGRNELVFDGLPPSLGILPKLETLNLSSNSLDGPLESLLRVLGNSTMPMLGYLGLSDNKLRGPLTPLEALPLVWSQLWQLHLAKNLLDGDLSPLSGFISLRVLCLEQNLLTGNLSGLERLTSLLNVSVADNKLTGDLSPLHFVKASAQSIQLGGNSLTGTLKTFPISVQSLNLSYNNLNGELPENLCMENLESLLLNNNNFSGPIPSRLLFVPMARTMDLSANSLEAPRDFLFDFTDMKNLETLNLSRNRISGHIPSTLVDLAVNYKLTHADFSNNNFSGPLPQMPVGEGRIYSFTGNSKLCSDNDTLKERLGLTELPRCPRASSNTELKTLPLVLGVVGASTMAVCSCFVLGWRWTVYSKRHRQDADLIDILQESATLTMPLKDLRKATGNFSSSCKIGEGGYGTVYYGELDDGTQVAIKRGNRQRKGSNVQVDKKEFLNEVKILSQVNHKNLVRLLGCCLANNIDALVFEYVPNGTLLEHIRGERSAADGSRLTWKDRLRIAVQTADALGYLHFSATPSIYHLDVKSANILLTDTLHAKVTDFGISKLAPREATWITRPAGTPGYMDPEYFTSCQPSDRTDVYSFGVVLLELISGKPVIDRQRGEESQALVSYALPFIRSGDVESLVDPSLWQNYDAVDDKELRELTTVAKLAERCLKPRSKDRPSMKDVWKELHALWATWDDGSDQISATTTAPTVLHRPRYRPHEDESSSTLLTSDLDGSSTASTSIATALSIEHRQVVMDRNPSLGARSQHSTTDLDGN